MLTVAHTRPASTRNAANPSSEPNAPTLHAKRTPSSPYVRAIGMMPKVLNPNPLKTRKLRNPSLFSTIALIITGSLALTHTLLDLAITAVSTISIATPTWRVG